MPGVDLALVHDDTEKIVHVRLVAPSFSALFGFPLCPRGVRCHVQFQRKFYFAIDLQGAIGPVFKSLGEL
jgi:hypothetical protein